MGLCLSIENNSLIAMFDNLPIEQEKLGTVLQIGCAS
jgi:hypothetical protein